IDDIREIIEGVRYAPVAARYKVYIIDEVHMLSKQAFNGLLKTLEEPPPHVKFVFATTEIRKVPVTVLSRCQRFDLRRIDSAELAAYLATLAEKEKVKIEEGALALIARAAEGSARDSLSLLDQAIAHVGGSGGEVDMITADTVRQMLGLADRGRVLDIFEKLMAGKVSEALTDLGALYDAGADPLAVMQDLLETTHFLTRVKVAPAAQGFFDGGSGEARRATELAAKLSVASLTRAWQILLKGLFEVRDATRPISACEMAMIRLAYAAELPPTDKLVKDLLDGGAVPAPRGNPAPAPSSSRAPVPLGSAMPARAPVPEGAPTASVRNLEDIVALCEPRSELRVNLEHNVHLVHLEPGRIEIRPNARAPRTLANDLQAKLRAVTGERWTVSIASQGGAPTLAEQKQLAKTARFEAVAQEPMVRAVLDRFPGAEIVAVRDVTAEDIAPSMPESDS
ncbi:MAG: DNA polymerase III subunit gamma/tau, partial [Rhizomicrobium sp.]